MKQYMTPEELSEEFSQSRTQIFKVLGEMRKHVGDGRRYGRYDLAGSRIFDREATRKARREYSRQKMRKTFSR